VRTLEFSSTSGKELLSGRGKDRFKLEVGGGTPHSLPVGEPKGERKGSAEDLAVLHCRVTSEKYDGRYFSHTFIALLFTTIVI
jgi:hypothetical protein